MGGLVNDLNEMINFDCWWHQGCQAIEEKFIWQAQAESQSRCALWL